LERDEDAEDGLLSAENKIFDFHIIHPFEKVLQHSLDKREGEKFPIILRRAILEEQA
jgi:hypothetical protein